MTRAIYKHGSFIVEKSRESATKYNVTHTGTMLEALKWLNRTDALALCDELVAADVSGETIEELVASPGWKDAIKIVHKYQPLSRKPKVKEK